MRLLDVTGLMRPELQLVKLVKLVGACTGYAIEKKKISGLSVGSNNDDDSRWKCRENCFVSINFSPTR